MNYSMSQITTLTSEADSDLPGIAAAGFTGVELSLEKIATFLKRAPVEALRDRLEELDLRATGAIGLAPEGPALLLARGAVFETHLSSLSRQLDICRALDIDNIGVGADAAKWRPDDDWRDGAIDNLKQAAALADGYGVRIGLEFMSIGPPIGPFIVGSLAEALTLIEETASPSLGVNLDFFHHYRGGGTTEQIANLDRSRIVGVHVTDVAAGALESLSDQDRVLPGEGVLDLAGYRDAIMSAGYDGCWTLELLNQDLWAMAPDKAARLGFRAMRRFAGADEKSTPRDGRG